MVTDIPECLEITATTDSDLVMGLRHRDAPTQGIQFHPESIMTESGHHLLANFLGIALPEALRAHRVPA